MIPKKIHYCWFGGNPKPEIAAFCIASWKKHLPEYEIIEWNESNFDVNQNNFVKTAYQKKKWAFVADFVRAKALFESGGFYLDTDMEVKNSLDDFLQYQAVCGFEMKGVPYSAFWGVEKGHILAKLIMEHYLTTEYQEIPNTKIFSGLLVEKFGANPENDHLQKLKYGVMLFPSSYFSLDLPINYVTHHFSGSWHNNWSEEENTYKNLVNMYGILKMITEQKNAKQKIKDVVYNHKLIKINEVLDQIPTQYIFQYMKQKLKQKILKNNKK